MLRSMHLEAALFIALNNSFKESEELIPGHTAGQWNRSHQHLGAVLSLSHSSPNG